MKKTKPVLDSKSLFDTLNTAVESSEELDQSIAEYFGYKHLTGKTWRTPRGAPKVKSGVPPFTTSLSSLVELCCSFLPDYQVTLVRDFSKPESKPVAELSHWTIPAGSRPLRPNLMTGWSNTLKASGRDRLGSYAAAASTLEFALAIAMIKTHYNHTQVADRLKEDIGV